MGGDCKKKISSAIVEMKKREMEREKENKELRGDDKNSELKQEVQ